MGRAILAVIVSYVVMILLTSAVFMGAYLVLGADQAFKPSSFQASNRWIVLMLVVSLVVAVIGGFICFRSEVSRDDRKHGSGKFIDAELLRELDSRHLSSDPGRSFGSEIPG